MKIADGIRGMKGLALMVGLCVSTLACTDRELHAVNVDGGGPGGTPGGFGGGLGVGGKRDTGGWQTLPSLGSQKVDILFMVDNSSSMAPLQAKLNAGFPAFINALRALPAGPPDMHIAVISSDTGPGKFDLPSLRCSFRGDQGAFQSQPRGNCTASPLLRGQTFLQVVNGVPSYAGDIADAFACIAALGDTGCGFEGQLKSVRWALDPVNLPPQNQGFLRPEARLVVVLVTNEDDCSLPDDSDLADPSQTLMSDPLGPLSSFRCNEFGQLCNIHGALVPPPRGPVDNLQCVSNETASGKLTRVTDETAFLKSLKSDPNQILVAAITGPATPYGVEMIHLPTDVEAHPSMKHSCSINSGEYADPAVRIAQWVTNFGANGLLLPICADSLAPQLETIAQRIGLPADGTCVTGPFPYSGSSGQPNCRVIDGNTQVGSVVQNCVDTGNVTPCWTAVNDPTCASGSMLLKIDRGSTPAPNSTTVFGCAPCPSDHLELGCSLP
jgi:hypothetical protein